MTRIKLSLLCLLLFCSADLLVGQCRTCAKNDDCFELLLPAQRSDSLKILQVTDLHLGHAERLAKDQATFQRLGRLVQAYNPDLVVITGDCFTGDAQFNPMLMAYGSSVFDQWHRPWLFAFGNHDPEGGRHRDSVFAVIARSRWGVLGRHRSADGLLHYDYSVKVRTDSSKLALWNLFVFDSGSEPGTRAISSASLQWYKACSASNSPNAPSAVPAVAFFHIPLREFKDLWDDANTTKWGECREPVCYEEDTGQAFAAFLRQGNMRACFCGHDHYNNYYGYYHGHILLAYGYISGESTRWAWPTGGRLINLPLDGGDIRLQTVVPLQ
jgi:3',5'-cyclic AMP phosphodiesterase CpdA